MRELNSLKFVLALLFGGFALFNQIEAAGDLTYPHFIDIATTATFWTLEFPEGVHGPYQIISGNTDQSLLLPPDLYLFKADHACTITRDIESFRYNSTGKRNVLEVKEEHSALHAPYPNWQLGWGSSTTATISFGAYFSLGIKNYATIWQESFGGYFGEKSFGTELLPGLVYDINLSVSMYDRDNPGGWVSGFVKYRHNGYFDWLNDMYYCSATFMYTGSISESFNGPPLPARELEFDCWFAH